MNNDNIVVDKSFAFAVRVVKLARWLKKEAKEYELASQVIKSGTSIGANVAEAQEAQSKADFISKMSIALKEASETIFWIKLLQSSEAIGEKEAQSLLHDAYELKKILTSIVKSTKEKVTP